MEAMEAMIAKHNRDLYEGEGVRSPSITARLFLVEDSMQKLLSNSKWLVRLVTGTFIVGIITVILHLIKP
jgi:hypothetical protein